MNDWTVEGQGVPMSYERVERSNDCRKHLFTGVNVSSDRNSKATCPAVQGHEMLRWPSQLDGTCSFINRRSHSKPVIINASENLANGQTV